MPSIDIIVIGASVGGVDALKAVVKDLPVNLNAAVFVVMHTSPNGPGLLPEILGAMGTLPAVHGRDGETFQTGRIYIAPPDHHLLLEAPDRMRVVRGPKENGSRPAIDPLFRTAAIAFGPRVAGVILTGNLDDGTVGLAAIKRRGGVTIVQEPTEASAPSMPLSALRHVQIDHCLRLADLAVLITSLAKRVEQSARPVETMPMADQLKLEVEIAAQDNDRDPAALLKLGDPSLFTCPECHGALVQVFDDAPLRFRCHTGHAFTANSLAATLGENTEDTLWTALRALQENVMLLRHMAAHSRDGEEHEEAAKLLREARDIQQRAKLVRQALLDGAASADRVCFALTARAYRPRRPSSR